MEKKDRLVIFDLDGTLFDTKNANYHAYKKALNKCGYNTSVDYNFFCEFCNGNSYKVFLPQIIPGISVENIERVHRLKKDVYVEFLDKAKKNIFLFDMINLLKKDYIIAIATTASTQNVNDILNKFDVKNVFDLIVTQEDVKNTKPNPECFLLAMKKSGVSPENTIIFEDSDVGIEAARLSGAAYFRVYGYN